MTTVYLIRHAQASGNLERIFQGRYDGTITPLGKKQLDGLAEHCRDLGLEAIYSSPLSRAYETAQAVNRYYNLPIVTEEGLLEINGGDWEGKKWQSFPVDYPEQNRNWYEAPWDFAAPGGETMKEVYDRMRDTLLHIVSQERGKTIAVVSHGCALANLITFCQDKPVTELNWENLCDNTAISKVVFDDKLVPHMEWVNDISHLKEEIKTYVTDLWGSDKKENQEG